MKKRIFSILLVLISVVTCGICLSACGNKSVNISRRVQLSLKDKFHIEYTNSSIYGHKYTATRVEDAIIKVGESNVNYVVWKYEEYHSEDNWRKAKYWLDAETNIVLKKTTVYPSSTNPSLDADENIGLQATYFDKTNGWTMNTYLETIDRNPAPDFSNFR
ncbi:MAG: hypothetical protein J5598_02475 [Clostridia bacterium]|nr:hypothetical protein [Clostridia bacterium]